TMELLSGDTMAAKLRRDGPFQKAEAFVLALQMAAGLRAAHDAGVVHLDFKPSNVMLVPAADGVRAVITDFGLARVDRRADSANAGDTSTGLLAGTLAYMSPEQLSGAPITSASDIYSFGIVLYEMATGHLPFDDRHPIN